MRDPVWRIPQVIEEAVRAIDARFVVPLAVAAIVVGGAASAELNLSTRLIEEHRLQVESGLNVMVVEGQTSAALSAERCESFIVVSGVVGSGSIRRPGGGSGIEFRKLPGTVFETANISPGFLAVWGHEEVPTPVAIALGEAAARELSVLSGNGLAVGDGKRTATVEVIRGGVPRAQQLDRVVAFVSPPVGLADECWVEFETWARGNGENVLAGWFGGTSTVRPLRTTGSFRTSLSEVFSERPQRFLWVASGMALGLSWLGLAWLRRSEYGLYRSLGAHRVHLMLMSCVQSALVGAWIFVVVVGLITVHHRLSAGLLGSDQVETMLRSIGASLALGTAFATLAPALISTGDVAGQLKDRA